MKALHPKLQELKQRTAGEYLTCRYIQAPPSMKLAATAEPKYKDNPNVIEGYLAVWGIKDSYGTVAVRGCFSKSITDRGPKSNAKNKIIHLFMHDLCEPVGSYLELVEDDYGLRFALEVDQVDGTPRRVLKQTRSGTINQYSYGFDYVWDKMEYDPTTDAVLMYEVDLYEGSSITVKAANPETSTIRSKQDLERVLLELGEQAEEVIEGLPRKQKLELRQLITRYKSLAEVKPLQGSTLDLAGEPSSAKELVVGTYKLNLNEF